MHVLEFLPFDDGVAHQSFHLSAGRSGLKVLSEALEFSSRLAIGQFERLAEMSIDSMEEDEIGRESARCRLVYLKKRYFGLDENASHSLPANRRFEPLVGEIYDLKKEIDELLKSPDYVSGGVDIVIHRGKGLPTTPKCDRLVYSVWNRPMELGVGMSQSLASLSRGRSVATLESAQHVSHDLINHCLVMYAIAQGELRGNGAECVYERFLQQYSVLDRDGMLEMINTGGKPLSQAFHILGRARAKAADRDDSTEEA